MPQLLLLNLVPLGFAVLILTLSIAIVPLSARHAPITQWRWLWGTAVVAVGGYAAITYWTGFVDIVPWWNIAVGLSVQVLVPIAIASWCARRAVRMWPHARWTVSATATSIVLVGGWWIGYHVVRRLIPDVVHAVK